MGSDDAREFVLGARVTGRGNNMVSVLVGSGGGGIRGMHSFLGFRAEIRLWQFAHVGEGGTHQLTQAFIHLFVALFP